MDKTFTPQQVNAFITNGATAWYARHNGTVTATLPEKTQAAIAQSFEQVK